MAGVVAIPTSLALETYIARSYYDVATQRLRILGANAVRSGAAYLPSNPQLAAQVADKVANQSGVAQEEIVATSVSEDGLGLTIRFEEKVPWHIAMFAFGQPKTIGVEATAQVSVRKSMAI
ncbi:MAG TPA: hypothetical protein VMT61_16900 [Candidatus Binataceae bacterium]|nr:hypothetical protein [Candidatus Binataceae bacterium]